MTVAITYPHIVKENGQPARLERHPRLRVAQIVMDYLGYGWSPDEIHRQRPYLTLAEVHAAMAYYYDQQLEIDAEITAELNEVDRALSNPKRSPMWRRLKAQGLIKQASKMAVAFYMDVHVHGAVTEQLRRRSVDVLTAQDDHADQLPDDQVLQRSTALGRVLFTYDIRFKALAEDCQRQGMPFAGLVWGHPMRLTIGQIVGDLELIAKATDISEWQNAVDQLPL